MLEAANKYAAHYEKLAYLLRAKFAKSTYSKDAELFRQKVVEIQERLDSLK